MRLRSSPVTMIWLPLILFFTVWSAHAKDDIPRIKSKQFQSRPISVQYFDDSDISLAHEEIGRVWRSTDGGGEWKPILETEGDEDGTKMVVSLWMHPYDNTKAYALGRNNVHWFTKDKGESWQPFTIPGSNVMATQMRLPLAFHAGNSKKVIFNGMRCENPYLCDEVSFFTTNDFKDVKELRGDSRGCVWAHATPQWHSDRILEEKDRILCVLKGDGSTSVFDQRIFMSDDFFETKEEPPLAEGRTVKGILNITVVKGYIITAAKSEGSSELSLYVTVDGERWHQAEFSGDQKLNENEYTIMESTNYSIQVDVMNTNIFNPMGVLFSSNSDGRYFTENIRHTNRNFERIVDFEKVQGIQGIVMVNVVKNFQEIERNPLVRKQVQSKISFDDGRTFKALTVGKNELHLHSVTDLQNVGRVFSSPAPGIIMGVGNTGDYLKPYQEGDLYVSDDAGVTWRLALDEPHKYEFGDQGTVLVAIADQASTKSISYSLNRGHNWTEVEIDDHEIRAAFLTTVPDSTSLKFILEATRREDDGIGFYLYSIDFNGIYKDKCGDSHFEEWDARRNEEGKPDCLMGQKQKYRRRKADADCYVGEKFREAKPEFEPCECTWEDFECDFDFKPDGEGEKKNCIPAVKLDPPEGACREGDKIFQGRAGFRKIPGNQCHDGLRKDEETVERSCDQTKLGPKPDGNLYITTTMFTGEGFGQKVYLERAERAQGEDETIIMSTTRGMSGLISGLWMSKDHGKTWKRILEDEDNIQAILQHPYQNDRAFFVAPNSKKVKYTVNRADTFEDFEAEAPLLTDWSLTPLSFHPTEKEYIVWTGTQNCGFSDNGDCHNVAYFSEDRGAHWKTIARYSQKCEFIKEEGRAGNEKLLYCVQHKGEKSDGVLELRSSDDFFSNYETRADNVLTFATMSEFIIVAQKDLKSNLKVKASIDGKTFADAEFPPDFNVPIHTAYTLLDSSTHAVFMHVTVGSTQGFEYGRIMKSNSNGTSYVLSVDAVNRNYDGYVDFEKMQGVEGVAMINVVANVEDEISGKAKKLRSLVTHNDGSEWAPLQAPAKKPDGSDWACDITKAEECSLHLHSYTERVDPRDTFSSPTAIGIMMGVGNVGKYLGLIYDPDDTYTFISTDAGVTWKAVMKGRFKWEYGDQGSVIVIVERAETNIGYYTTDEGANWKEFNFAEKPVTVLDLSTVPSDNSKQFLIWLSYGNGQVGTVNVDFSNIRNDRFCKVDEEHDHADSDYYLWSPKHPLQDNDCLFGRTVKYLRKKPEADCWNGPKLEGHHGEITNCTCTKLDFEW